MAYTEILVPQAYINDPGGFDFFLDNSGLAWRANLHPDLAVSAMAANDTNPIPIPPGGIYTWGKWGHWNITDYTNGRFSMSNPLINGLVQKVAVRLLLFIGGAPEYSARIWTHGTQYALTGAGLTYLGQSSFPPGVGWGIWEGVWPLNPFTTATWTLAELSDVEAGFRIYAATLHYVAIDQLFVLVTYSRIPPTVATNVASNVIPGSATLHGTLVDDGGEACTLFFEWGPSMALGNTAAAGTGSTGASFSANISGLLVQNYYFRAGATNSRGTTYGAVLSLTGGTPGPHDIPSVDTLAATGVTNDAGLIHGMVTNSLGQYGDVRFEVGGTSSYGNTTPWQSGFFTSDLFQYQLTNLVAGGVYHFRAQFRTSGGIVSGSDQSFVTLSELGPVTFADEETMSLLED